MIFRAIPAYILIAIVKKRLHLSQSPCAILQILSLTLLEKMPILLAVAPFSPIGDPLDLTNQLCLQGLLSDCIEALSHFFFCQRH